MIACFRLKSWALVAVVACWLMDCRSSAAAASEPGLFGIEKRLSGKFGGELNLAALSGLGLRWHAELGDGPSRLNFSAETTGLTLRLEAAPTSDGGLHWHITQGAGELSELWPVLKTTLGKAAGDWVAGGKIEISGEGDWSPSTGPVGVVRFALRDGWARSDELAVELSGIMADVQSVDFKDGTLALGQSLHVAKITAAGVLAERLEVRFSLAKGWVFELASADLDVLGGKARINPFSFPLSAKSAEADAVVEGISLAELSSMLPSALSGAQGKLGGRLNLRWDIQGGLQINTGGLAIVKSDDAVLTLAPTPGFLTSNIPRRIPLLPPWCGPLARWIAPENPAYASLQAIEMGRAGLALDSLEVAFNTNRADGERTATVRLQAHPVGIPLIDKVSIEVNLAGALTRVLQLGLDGRTRLNVRKP
ncbi:MAG: hypothetical protein RIQ79_1402 [Verrucomicrobiota bacterium]